MSEDFSDLAGIVDDLAESATLVRTAAGVLGSDGFYRENVATESTISVVTYPTPGREAAQLPEGVRTKELRTFVTTDELAGAIAPSGRPADRIKWGGATYEVQRSAPHTQGGFWVNLCVRVGP